MRAWKFQDHRAKQKLGSKAKWSVGWIDPEGRKRSKQIGSKSMAQKYARKLEGQLAAGTYEAENRTRWSDFVEEYRTKIMAGMEPGTRELTDYAIRHFTRIIKPVRMVGITTKSFADYTAVRRLEPCRKGGPPVSPATVNRELRSLRAIVRKAHRWDWLAKLPEIEFLREPGKLPLYVPPEHFDLIYQHCDTARLPVGLPYPAGDWWRALLVTAYLTGWRIGALLSLRRSDVDLEAGTAFSGWSDTKGKRDQLIPLHPVIVEHLRKLPSFSLLVFPWDGSRSLLREVFAEVQQAAGVKPDRKSHYGFHDVRRGFASMNSDRLTPDQLQTLMQHKSYITTQRYINLGRQMKGAVEGLFVPASARSKSG